MNISFFGNEKFTKNPKQSLEFIVQPMNHKFSRNDDYLKPLFNELSLAQTIYDSLLVPANNKDRIIDHKFSTNTLIEEIDKACHNIANWTRGKEQIRDLIELKYKLLNYVDIVFRSNERIAKLRFNTNHHKFFAVLEQLLRMFD